VILYVPDYYSSLVVGLSLVVAYLIPGYLLKNRNKRAGHV
jgi:hypothetical protein